jgi:hypothetical protein
MASSSASVLLLLCFAAVASAQLSPTFYDTSCPNALSTIKSAVTAAVNKENRMGASLLRLHFHDCFVQVNSFTVPDFMWCMQQSQFTLTRLLATLFCHDRILF